MPSHALFPNIVLAVAIATALLPGTCRADAPDVIADTPVVGSLVAMVMGATGAPLVLLEQGADAHDFQLRPSRAQAIADADAIFRVDDALTPWLGRAIAGTGWRGRDVSLLRAPGLIRPADPSEPVAAGSDHAEDDHDHGGIDPHAWLNPDNAKLWIDVIATELAGTNPAQAQTYAANAAAAKADIDRLAAGVRATMAPVGSAPVVMFHDAYAYFADAFGLNIVATISESDAQRPGAGRLAEIRDMLRATPGVCVFPEANHDPKYVATVTEGSGAKIGAPLDPEGSTLPYGAALYGDLLRSLATAIAECVGRE